MKKIILLALVLLLTNGCAVVGTSLVVANALKDDPAREKAMMKLLPPCSEGKEELYKQCKERIFPPPTGSLTGWDEAWRGNAFGWCDSFPCQISRKRRLAEFNECMK